MKPLMQALHDFWNELPVAISHYAVGAYGLALEVNRERC